MTNLSGEQLVLYILLPTSVFIFVVLVVCCCYRERKLCFRKDRGETLLAPEQKNRFRIKLGKNRSPSYTGDSGGNGSNQDEKVIGKASVVSPAITQPLSYTESAPVGQIPSRSLSSSPPETQLARQTHYSLQVEQTQAFSEIDSESFDPGSKPSNVVPKRRPTNLGSDSNGSTTFHLLDPATSSSSQLHPVKSSRSFDSRAKPLSSPDTFRRTPLSLPDLTHRPADRPHYQPSPSPHSLFPVDEENPMFFSDTMSGSRRSSYDVAAHESGGRGNEGGGLVARDSLSSAGSLVVSPAHASQHLGRRRSSMQMPIDLRQIDPRLYKLHTPSVDSTDGDDDTPMLHFSLAYNSEFEVLNVKLIQARSLATQVFSGTADPYCTVALVPGFNPRRSKVHKKTSNPEFEECFTFSVSSDSLEETILEVKTFDFDQFSRDECTGVMQMKMKEIDFVMTPSIDLWRKIKPPKCSDISKSSETYGDLMLALSYLRSAEKLTVAVQKARNLREPESRKGLPDSYVKVALYKGKQRLKKKKTDTVHSTCNPVFNQALTFSVPHETLQSPDARLICHVVHDFKLGYNEYLGQLDLGPNSTDSEESNHWSEMMTQHINRPIARWHRLKQSTTPAQRLSTDENMSGSTHGRRKSFAVPEALQLHGLAELGRKSFS